jgi:hypothetical protein
MNGHKRIVALDLAFRNVGFSEGYYDIYNDKLILNDIKRVSIKATNDKKIRKSSDDLRCAMEMTDEIGFLCYKEGLDKDYYIAAEIPSGTQSARASWSLGIALGTLTYLSRLSNKDLIEVTPSMVKKIVDLGKNPDKKDIINWAVKKYPHLNWKTIKRKGLIVYTNDNEHCADAIAVMEASVPIIKQQLTVL